MRSLLFTFLLLTSHLAFGDDEPLGNKQIQFGTLFETNTFYSSTQAKAGEALFIRPKAAMSKDFNSVYSLSTDSQLEYFKYLKYSNQNYYQYDVNLRNNFAFSKKFEFSLTPFAKLLSEPAQSEDFDRLQRSFIGVQSGLLFKFNDRKQVSVDFQYKSEQLNQSDYHFLNNNRIDIYAYAKKYFLPETFYYYGFRLGNNQFPQGDNSPVNRPKYSSRRIEPGIGLEGRLTRYFKIRSYLGYSVIQYTQDVNFSDPVFTVELEEELSPRDLILMGFDSSTEDAYFSNFVSNEKVYVGYGRFLGDQVLSTTKMEYVYRSFSRPNRRNDQRIVLSSDMEYSYTQNLKVGLNFLFDLLSSDATNPDGPPTPFDPSASYENIRLTLSGKYLF